MAISPRFTVWGDSEKEQNPNSLPGHGFPPAIATHCPRPQGGGGGGRRPGGVGVTGIALWSRDRGGGLLPRRTSFFSCSLRSPLETLRVSHAHSVRTSTPHGFSCSAPPEHRTRTSGAQARFARTPCQPHSEDLRSSRFRFRSHSEPLQISRTPVSHLRCSRSSSSELSRPADSRSPNGGKRLAEGQKLEHHQVRSHHGPAYW
ncbi:hypothetical protein BN140_3007 [Methanoculleus bourgensis MS2]|uniref:Uncharacterized protein n=1 Tax=Methanoculleus bourgensis (strain ATCC 43281 / DSM 3045 / OCM 15 / MS2) TaxID=1201294 RepID=W6PVZ0_METBM|nr:hypothetical protein BN140_3007 [Methanoculleus bourgensis MS2]